MDALDKIGAIVGLLILRLGVPVAITVGIGYWFTRLDRRWQAQATGTRKPCWELKNCSPESRARCVAYQHADIPCWALVRATEGQLRPECTSCPAFVPVQVS